MIFYFFRKEHWQLGSNIYRLVLWIQNNPEDNDTLASVLALCVDMWTLAHAWGAYLLSFNLNLWFMHTFKTTIKLMMITESKFGRNIGSEKVFQEKLLIYSKLRILTTVFNDVYGMTFIPMTKTIMGILLAGSIFITVRLAPRSGLLIGMFGGCCAVVCVVIQTMFIIFTAMVNEYSVKFRLYARSNGFSGKWAKRALKAYKVEAVKSGEFYNIQRITCLTVMGMISNLCGSILISVKV